MTALGVCWVTPCIRRWRCIRPMAASYRSSPHATIFVGWCRWWRTCSSRTGKVLADLDGIAYTQGPGLAGALLVGASVATALGFALGKPVLAVHHLEAHLLSPLLGDPKPDFPSSRCWFPEGTRSSTRWRQSAITRCSEIPSTMPPEKPSTRPPLSSASVIQAVPSWRSLPRRGDRARSYCHGR